MTVRSPSEIRSSFSALRLMCDPRGHGLIDELERLSLFDASTRAFNERLSAIERKLSAPPNASGQPASPAAPGAGAENVLHFPGHSVRV